MTTRDLTAQIHYTTGTYHKNNIEKKRGSMPCPKKIYECRESGHDSIQAEGAPRDPCRGSEKDITNLCHPQGLIQLLKVQLL